MTQQLVTPDASPPRGLRQRIRDLSPLQLGLGYLVLFFVGGGLESSVIAPGRATSDMVLLPWVTLVALIALLRDDEPFRAAVLAAVFAAVSAFLALLLRAAGTESVWAQMAPLRFNYIILPAAVGVVAAVNTGVVVAIARFFQRRTKQRRTPAALSA